MKGQTIMEYLTTYGWAIVLIIIGGAVLFRMGVFNMSWIAGDQCSPCFADFHVQDWKYDTTGTLTLAIANKRGATISVTTANTTISAEEFAASAPALPATMAANGQQTFTFTGFTALPADSQYTADVEIIYTDTASGLSHTDTAKLQGSVET